MASPSAADRAFAVLELAETIFLEVPARQILVNAQCVCRQWKALIEWSKPLQQALFFEPIPSIRVVAPDGDCESSNDWGMGWIDVETSAERLAVEHPLTKGSRGWDCFRRDMFAKDCVKRPEASWRRQLYIQPPAQKVSVYVNSRQLNGVEITGDSRWMDLERRDGVLVRQILEESAGYYAEIWRQYRLEPYDWNTESAASFLDSVTKRVTKRTFR